MTDRLALLIFGLATGLIAAGVAANQPAVLPMPGVADAAQAHIDYKLKCQGCHRPDGSGDDTSNPPMRDMVARFLSVPGGREFLGRVPGVATQAVQKLIRLIRRHQHRDARLTPLASVARHRRHLLHGGC